jgi:hypothetical protein
LQKLDQQQHQELGQQREQQEQQQQQQQQMRAKQQQLKQEVNDSMQLWNEPGEFTNNIYQSNLAN